jgi:hypothetical protein
MGVGALAIGAAALAAPLRADATGTVFLQATAANPMECNLVSASTSVVTSSLPNKTVWSCAGAVSTNATQVGASAGTVLVTATTPAGPADCAVGTTAAFTFVYADPFGTVSWSASVPYVQSGIICQTNYAGSASAATVSGNGINTYPLLDELCQFSLTGPLGGFGGFGTSVPLTFDIDSSTGCAPRNT